MQLDALGFEVKADPSAHVNPHEPARSQAFR
jgi:hypothetical protein